MMSKLRTAWKEAKTLGVRNALHDLAYRAVNRACYFKALKVIKITEARPKFLKGDEKYQSGFLDRELLLRFAAVGRYDLEPEFVEQALKKGDECYAIVDGDQLANYGWYSHQATTVEDDLPLHFDRAYVYMYKGFTDPRYRGQRLHGINMTRALKAYLDRGYAGLISYVESNNFASLKSCYRMGYVDVGKVYVARLGGRYLSHANKGCRPYGFGLEALQASCPAEESVGVAITG
jgi:hypothetical protein